MPDTFATTFTIVAYIYCVIEIGRVMIDHPIRDSGAPRWVEVALMTALIMFGPITVTIGIVIAIRASGGCRHDREA